MKGLLTGQFSMKWCVLCLQSMCRWCPLGPSTPQNSCFDKSIIKGLFLRLLYLYNPLAQWNCIFSLINFAIFISCLVIICRAYMWNKIHVRKFKSFIGSRTWVLSFLSPMFFHWASWPQRRADLVRRIFSSLTNWANTACFFVAITAQHKLLNYIHVVSGW
jgi:hypothetical protein